MNMNMLIEELDMSKRTTLALIENGIRTVNDLSRVSLEDMRKWRHFGTMSSEELLRKMRELNIPLNISI